MVRFLLIPLLCLAFAPLANAEVPYQKMTFEDGSFQWWDTHRLVGDYSGTVVTSPVRSGKYAGRFELRAGDIVSQGHRAEAKDRFYAKIGSEVWYGFSTYIPEDFPIAEDNSCVLTQWHDHADGAKGEITRSPPMAHRYREGRLDVTFRTSPIRIQKEQAPEQIIYSEPNFQRGVWHDFVYQVKWSYKQDGYVRAWKNGRMIINYSGPVGYNDAVGPYVKLGVYCRNQVNEPLVAYHDNYARGNSYREVDPSQPPLANHCPANHRTQPVLNTRFEYLGNVCQFEDQRN